MKGTPQNLVALLHCFYHFFCEAAPSTKGYGIKGQLIFSDGWQALQDVANRLVRSASTLFSLFSFFREK